jgi:PIN domain nuclease of toxin-antitoxin system
MPISARYSGVLPDPGFERIGIADACLPALAGRPVHDRNPFDPLLTAQAVAQDAHFVSEDQTARLDAIRF